MPRDRGQEHILNVPYPITATEMRTFIETADKRGLLLQHLDDAAVEALATWLSGMTVEGARRHPMTQWTSRHYKMTEADVNYRKRWHEAAALLRNTRKHHGSFPGAVGTIDRATDILETALAEAERLLDATPEPNPHPQMKHWVFRAMHIVFTMSEIVKSLGGKGGVSRNSIAAKFAALALERIGWRDERGRPVKASAIAEKCERLKASSTEHNRP